jgi:hypothetical protein
MKKSIEYRKENLEEVCDANCGKHKTEGSCLSCKNCGVCKLTKRDKVYTYCLPGNKESAFFNEQCKNTAWTFRGDESKEPVETKPKITIDTKPRTYTSSSATSYDDLLKSLGQQNQKKSTVNTSGDAIGTTTLQEEEKILGVRSSAMTTTNKSYTEVLSELERLSAYFKK